MLLFVLCILSYSSLGLSIEVSTSLGLVKGNKHTSRGGRDYLAFPRVPFAKPPIGQLRFKVTVRFIDVPLLQDPQTLEPWKGVANQENQLNMPCFQFVLNKTSGTEDCLYLNVLTPNVSGSLPVMVYLFGGGWRVGAPGAPTSANYFMDEDVVLVMPNYRLGALGFLSTEDETVPGNMGLKDMAAAIEWTKKEISNFGGNPEMITAFGLSAGAASAHYLCSVPRTKELLKGCISQSGVGGSHWSLKPPGMARATAKTIANALGCSDGEEMLACLQSKTPEEITKTENLFWFWAQEPMIIHGPVLEPKHDNAILTEWPLPSNFPWLTGFTSQEGLFRKMTLMVSGNEEIFAAFEKNKKELVRKILHLPENSNVAVETVIDKFFTNKDIKQGMEELYSEAFFIYPALHEIRKHKGPKFLYMFNCTGGPSLWEVLAKKQFNITSGVSHGDDHLYFFDLSTFFGPAMQISTSTPSGKSSQKLIRLWVNFAKYQTPTPEGVQPQWEQFGNTSQYLEMTNEAFEVKEYKNMTEMLQFWDSIFNKSS